MYLTSLLGARPVPEVKAQRRERILKQVFEWDDRFQGDVRQKEGPKVELQTELTAMPLFGSRKRSDSGAKRVNGDQELRQATLERLASLCKEAPAPDPELAYRAHHDALTGLPNRPAFEERMKQGLAYARRYQRSLAVLFIDLDGFKSVNDSFGHSCGDAVLREAGQRFQSALRESDLVARWGGDEFVAGLLEVGSRADAGIAAAKLQEALTEPFVAEGQQIKLSASIGISLFPEDGTDLATLVRKADLAMYQGKKGGKNGAQFSSGEEASSREPLLIEGHLRHALERREFSLYYQPQYDLRTGKLAALEALLRWKHPRLGVVQPASFLPLAEKSWLMLPISAWTMETACRQIRRLREAGIEDVRVAVNISASEFAREDFVSSLARTMEAAGAIPEYLELDVPEGVLASNLERAAERLKELKGLGVGISADDFGSSRTSLEYVQRLPIDGLKLDPRLVRGLAEAGHRPLLVRSLIALAQSAGLRANAEGVETVQELEALRSAGCDAAQGYLLGMPAPVEDLISSGVPVLGV